MTVVLAGFVVLAVVLVCVFVGVMVRRVRRHLEEVV